MEPEIVSFQKRHPELILLAVTHGSTTTVYNFMAPDGLRVNVSLDFGRWKHMSFSKRQPPLFLADTMGHASEREMSRYLDFFDMQGYERRESPLGCAICHFYQAGHPDIVSEVVNGT